MGKCLLNLLSIRTNNSTSFGLPKESKAVSAALMLLPVYKTSSINTTDLFSTTTYISVDLGDNIVSDLLQSSLKKVTSNLP